jgi:ABC-type multidrug transport system fused ATPase/permease subunit
VDVPQVRNLVGDLYNIMILVLVVLFGGIGVALYYSWRIALVVLATIPLLVAGGALQMRMVMSSMLESAAKGKASADHASMVLGNVRLITSMGRASHMLAIYHTLLDGPQRQIAISNAKLCLVAFFGEFSRFGAFALAFYYGSVVVDKGQNSFSDMFTALTGVLFCGIIAGVYASQLPKISDAKDATARVRELLNSLSMV